MKIRIYAAEGEGVSYIPESLEEPIVGRIYYLFDAGEYTDSQRKTFEALADEWYKSGKWDYDTIDKWKFREHIKLDYGEGFNRLKYVDDNFKMVEVKNQEEIPDYVIEDFSTGNRERVQGVIKSTTEYTRKQFTRLIDNVLNAMMDAGVDSKKFQDIIKELNSEKVL